MWEKNSFEKMKKKMVETRIAGRGITNANVIDVFFGGLVEESLGECQFVPLKGAEGWREQT